MKFLYWLFAFSILLAVFVGAGCTDSDGGPVDIKKPAAYLVVPGNTADTFKTYSDSCVKTELSDKKVSESPWLREYYCSESGLAKHKDFKCADYDSELCISDDRGSYCKSDKPVSTLSSSSSSVKKEKKQLADFYCGSKVMNRADAECYPPGKLCVKDRMPGECSASCKCIPVGSKSEKSRASSEKKSVEVKKEQPEEESEQKPKASIDIIVPAQTGVSASHPEKVVEKKSAEASPIKQTVTLRVVFAVANGVKKVWSGIIGLF